MVTFSVNSRLTGNDLNLEFENNFDFLQINNIKKDTLDKEALEVFKVDISNCNKSIKLDDGKLSFTNQKGDKVWTVHQNSAMIDEVIIKCQYSSNVDTSHLLASIVISIHQLNEIFN